MNELERDVIARKFSASNSAGRLSMVHLKLARKNREFDMELAWFRKANPLFGRYFNFFLTSAAPKVES